MNNGFGSTSAMLSDIENFQEKLSQWERNFIDSVQHQLGKGKSLTKNQEERLTIIWERVTDI